MSDSHVFAAKLVWVGAESGPTSSYESYSRKYEIIVAGKPKLTGSAASVFRGDASLHNPEDLLVAALSSCHMLSYLALCARRGIAVASYEDECVGRMAVRDGVLRFVECVLRPEVVLASGDVAEAERLHKAAHHECFIAASVNFPVRCEAVIRGF